MLDEDSSYDSEDDSEVSDSEINRGQIENLQEMHKQELAQFIREHRILNMSENLFVFFGTFQFLDAIKWPADN